MDIGYQISLSFLEIYTWKTLHASLFLDPDKRETFTLFFLYAH